MLRVEHAQEREVPIAPEPAELLPGSWRRWRQAFEAYDSGDEAEVFQSVGVRLRECLVSFVGETPRRRAGADSQSAPKAADFKGWTELLANRLAAGESAARLRSYLKKLAVETWEYVNWLTHAKNAVRIDAEIGLKAVEHLLGTYIHGSTASADGLAEAVRGMRLVEVAAGSCRYCERADPAYVQSEPQELSEDERVRRLAQPGTPSSEISTFVDPNMLRREGRRDRL